MFEYPFVEWNLYKLTAVGKGSMPAARKGSTMGHRQWKGYPCYYHLFSFSNLTGRILSFGRSSDFDHKMLTPGFVYPERKIPYSFTKIGALVVAHDWFEVMEHKKDTKPEFAEPRLYRIADIELPKEASRRAMITLNKTIEMYNIEYGFSPRHTDYHGFSEGLEKTG